MKAFEAKIRALFYPVHITDEMKERILENVKGALFTPQKGK